MAISTSNVKLSGKGTPNANSLYVQMGKIYDNLLEDFSFSACRYGPNPVYFSTHNTNQQSETSSNIKFSTWRNVSYDHHDLQFRFNPVYDYAFSQTAGYTFDTYDEDYYVDSNTAFKFGGGILNGGNYGVEGSPSGVYDGSGYGSPDRTLYMEPRYSPTVTWNNVAGGTSYKPAANSTGTMFAWVKFGTNSAGQTTILTNDCAAFNSHSPYTGWKFDVRSTDNKLVLMRGDGGGTATGNRRTFVSTSAIDIGVWNFFAWVFDYSSVSVTSTTNYCYIYSTSNGWKTAGAVLNSGTGSTVVYNNDNYMIYGAGSTGGRYFNGTIGHNYWFDQALTSTQIQDCKDNTDIYSTF